MVNTDKDFRQMAHDIQEDIFATKEEEAILSKYNGIPEKVKVKVKPHVPLSELVAPLLQKWGK